ENLIPSEISVLFPPIIIQKLISNSYLFIILSSITTFVMLLKYARNFDIIHTESFPCLIPTILIAKMYNKKTVWITHSLTIPTPSNPIAIIGFIIAKLDLYFAHYIGAIIAVSPKTKSALAQLKPKIPSYIIIPPINIARLTNPTKSFVRNKYNLNQSIVLLCVGVIHPSKNQLLAVQALKELKKTFPRICLIIVGGGSQDILISQIQALALTFSNSSKNINLDQPDIILAGLVAESELKNYYEDSDLILLPSLPDQEGLGITPLEGLYLNKLSVVVQGPGIAQIIIDHNIGLVCKPTLTHFVETIKNYLSNTDKYLSMIASGHQYVLENNSIKNYTKNVLEVYNNI
ncbi:MAG: glycosyltransferase family 4 protein, partial [bacterium]|nr:glycosyltransferase family 4 protein [bacterium]